MFPPESPLWTRHLTHDRQGRYALRVGQTVVFGPKGRSRGVLRSITDSHCEVQGYRVTGAQASPLKPMLSSQTAATAHSNSNSSGTSNSDSIGEPASDKSTASTDTTAASATANTADKDNASAEQNSTSSTQQSSSSTTYTAADVEHESYQAAAATRGESEPCVISLPRSAVQPAHQSIFWRLLRPEFVKRRGGSVWEQRAVRQRLAAARASSAAAQANARAEQAALVQAALTAEAQSQADAGYGAAETLLYRSMPQVRERGSLQLHNTWLSQLHVSVMQPESGWHPVTPANT